MVNRARQAGVPLLLVNPVSNLRDCPPFKAEHRDGLAPEELKRWNGLRETASGQFENNMLRAVGLLEQARAIDDQHAGIHYELGKCYEALGALDRARQSYLLAKELDICPLRILEPMNKALLQVAGRTGTPVVDFKAMIERHSSGRIPGNDWLLDHVHPSMQGHQLIAGALAEEMVRRGILVPRPGWARERERLYSQHYGALGDLYFATGMQRLENVRQWARGRIGAESPDPIQQEGN
jgi:hypothetical protein